VRYIPGYYYFYPSMNHHVPRVPLSYTALPGHLSDILIKHYGWSGSEEDRRGKYLRYRTYDPGGFWGNSAQYESILELHPHLVEWREEGS